MELASVDTEWTEVAKRQCCHASSTRQRRAKGTAPNGCAALDFADAASFCQRATSRTIAAARNNRESNGTDSTVLTLPTDSDGFPFPAQPKGSRCTRREAPTWK